MSADGLTTKQKAVKAKADKQQRRKEMAKAAHAAALRRLPPLPLGQPRLNEARLARQQSSEEARRRFNQLKNHAAENDPKAAPQEVQRKDFQQLRDEWAKLIGHLLHFDETERERCTALSAKIMAIEDEWARRRALLPGDDGYFKWPVTTVVRSAGHGPNIDRVETGMLSYLGYHVGKSSTLQRDQRQRLLAHIFEMRLPPLESVCYMAEWSLKRSPERLKKMADCIAHFAQLAKRRRNSMWETAISDWESDLAYLKQRFYIHHFKFAWPSTKP